MKRFFLFIVLLFVATQLSSVSAQTPTPSPLPNGAIMSVDGVLVPGVTCGVPGDADPGKAKCCVPKKNDDSIWQQIGDTASKLPVVGGIFTPVAEQYKAIDDMSKKMEPCGAGGSPSTPHDLYDKTCICVKEKELADTKDLNVFCTKYFHLTTGSNEIQKCTRCMVETGGFYTSLGCIPFNLSSFITNYILGIGIGVAGGIALLCIIYSAFRMQTSLGNAEAIKKAQESLTACITGLIIIIFSVLILKIIGVDILRIPSLL